MSRTALRSVLIVDDDPVYLALYRRQLEAYADTLEVQCAEDGYQALEYLAENEPALIILDISMPRFDGHEFLAILMAKDAYAQIPIWIFSSMTDDFAQLKKKHGNALVARKPVTDELLKQALRIQFGDPSYASSTTSAPSRSGRLFNHETLVRFTGQNPQTQKAVVTEFCRLVPERKQRVLELALGMRLDDLRDLLHALEGSLGMIGGTTALKTLHELRDAAASTAGNDAIPNRAKALVAALSDLQRELQQTFELA